MDSLTTAAARALAAGDPLRALNFVALRDDAPALALRGIAMAQLGDLVRARTLLRRAARAFGPREAVARARCVVAEAEIALVSRDLGWPAKPLDSAQTVLERHGERANAAHARYLAIRRLLLIGRLDQAEHLIKDFDPTPLPPASRAAHELVVAGIAMRRLRIDGRRCRAHSRPQRRTQGWHPGAIGGSRRRGPCARRASSTGHREGQGAAGPTRRDRGPAGIQDANCRRLPPCRVPCRPDGFARNTAGTVCARARDGRGLARRRVAQRVTRAGVSREACR